MDREPLATGLTYATSQDGRRMNISRTSLAMDVDSDDASQDSYNGMDVEQDDFAGMSTGEYEGMMEETWDDAWAKVADAVPEVTEDAHTITHREHIVPGVQVRVTKTKREKVRLYTY